MFYICTNYEVSVTLSDILKHPTIFLKSSDTVLSPLKSTKNSVGILYFISYTGGQKKAPTGKVESSLKERDLLKEQRLCNKGGFVLLTLSIDCVFNPLGFLERIGFLEIVEVGVKT